MPFSSQPLKKGKTGPQDGIKKPSCGHVALQKSCPDCQKAAQASKPNDTNVIDLPTEKKKLATLQEKIADKLIKDNKATDKAAFVISQWISGTRIKKSK